MSGFLIGAAVGLALNYAAGRGAAPFTWEHYRGDWWATFSFTGIILGAGGGLIGMCIGSIFP